MDERVVPQSSGNIHDIVEIVVSEEQIFSFLQTRIRSVWALELLVLLARGPNRTWQSDELVREMRSSTAVVDQAANNLLNAGLVERTPEGTCRFAPASPELRELAGKIEKVYAAKPTAIIKAILTAPDDKLRTFADAFKFRE